MSFSEDHSSMTYSKKLLSILLLVLLVSACLLSIASHINDLPTADEPQLYDMARSILATGLPYAYSGDLWHPVIYHPTLYYHLAALATAISMDYPGLRILDLLLWSFGVVLCALAVRKPGKTDHLWTAILMLIPPLMLQGALLVDIDGSLLVACAGLWVYCWQRIARGKKRYILLSAVMFISLWSKLFSPTLWCLGAIVAGLIYRRNDWTKDGLIALLAGGATFLLTWTIYCQAWGIDFLGPLLCGFGKAEAASSSWLINLGKNIVRLILWLGPAWVLLLFARRQFLKDDQDTTPLFFGGLAIAFFHLLIGAIAFGFPKYYTPMIPLLAVGIAPLVAKAYELSSPKVLMATIVVLVMGLMLPIILGDPLLPILASTRQGVDTTAITFSAITLLVPVIAALGFWFWLRKETQLVFLLLPAALGYGVGVTLTQSEANYSVRYIYGEQGINNVIATIQQRVPHEAEVIIPGDIAFLIHYPPKFHQAEAALGDIDKLCEVLQKPENSVFIIRESMKTHAAYARTLNDDRVIRALENYNNQTIGSFTLYWRSSSQTLAR